MILKIKLWVWIDKWIEERLELLGCHLETLDQNFIIRQSTPHVGFDTVLKVVQFAAL